MRRRCLALLLLVALSCLVSPASAAVRTFTGAAGTQDWSNSSNWDLGLPGAQGTLRSHALLFFAQLTCDAMLPDDVIIATNAKIDSPLSFAVGNLSIRSSASLSIAKGAALTAASVDSNGTLSVAGSCSFNSIKTSGGCAYPPIVSAVSEI